MSIKSQIADKTILESYHRAEKILADGIEASGGLNQLRSIRDVSVSFKGQRNMLNQSLTPDGELDVEPSSGRVLVDIINGRMFAESVNQYPPKEVFSYRWVLKGNEGFIIDLMKNNQGSESVPLGGNGVISTRANFYRNYVPFLLLLQAADQKATLRWIGETQDGKEKFEIITFVQPDKTQTALYFDAATHLLRKVEWLEDDGVLGDKTLAVNYSDYRQNGKLKVPSKRTDTSNGILVRDLNYEAEFNTGLAENLYELPAGYSMPKPPTSGNDSPVNKLADGVFTEKNTNTMFVEFKDYILVAECTTDSATTKAVIDVIHATIPNKPIKYLTFTHYHNDHSGGMRSYIAEGATIITTKGNKSFVERVANTKHTIKPDALSLNPVAPKMEFVDGKRVITDGNRTVEIYNISPTPHVAEMLIFYLPKEKILFQGDMFFVPATGEVAPAIEITDWFAKKIKSMGLQFDTIVDADGRAASVAEFREALKKGGFKDAY